MRYYYIYKYVFSICKFKTQIIFLSFFIFSGCSKFLDVSLPKQELVSDGIFDDKATANAAVLSIYSKMINDQSFPYFIALYTGYASDELKNYSSDPYLLAFYVNGLNSLNPYIYQDLWTPIFNFIYQANTVIEQLNKGASISNDLQKQLVGEAKFIRAFCNFYLINLFGNVPLVTTTDYLITSRLPREMKDKIYDQIINDLNDAYELLSDFYVDASGVALSNERVRPNKWTAYALLARVYLFMADYSAAERTAALIINNSQLYSLPMNLDSVYLMNSSETIWALQPSSKSGLNTPEGYQFILINEPEASGRARCSTLSAELVNSFEPNDQRKMNWIGNYQAYYYPYKYKISSQDFLSEYSIVFRLAEQYLIRAEARAQQGKFTDAIADINLIRNRAGLENYANSIDLNAIQSAILHERQIELFTEWGHRWFDLSRTNSVDSVMSVITPRKNGTWDSYDRIFPIPNRERERNNNLSQNEGY